MATKKSASAKKPTPKKKVVAKKAAPVTDKASLQQQLAALEAQMEALNTEAVQELMAKISDTKKVLRGYELQLDELTGKSTAPSKGKRTRHSSIFTSDFNG